MKCRSYDSTGTTLYEEVDLYGSITFLENVVSSGITISTNPSVNGATDAYMTVVFTTMEPIVIGGTLVIGLPS